MNEQQRDELRERNQRRAIACRRCGSTSTAIRDGAELSSDAHFPGTKYKVCGACGYEEPRRTNR
jgi:ribosomal protein L37E